MKIEEKQLAKIRKKIDELKALFSEVEDSDNVILTLENLEANHLN